MSLYQTLCKLRDTVSSYHKDTTHLHYDDLERAENYNCAIDDCLDEINELIDDIVNDPFD